MAVGSLSAPTLIGYFRGRSAKYRRTYKLHCSYVELFLPTHSGLSRSSRSLATHTATSFGRHSLSNSSFGTLHWKRRLRDSHSTFALKAASIGNSQALGSR